MHPITSLFMLLLVDRVPHNGDIFSSHRFRKV